MTLYNAAGAAIPTTAINVTSANFLADSPAPRCSDGRNDTLCHSSGGAAWLRLWYRCPGGKTALSKVVVTNRPTAAFSTASTRTAWSSWTPAVPVAFQFAGNLSTYTVTP